MHCSWLAVAGVGGGVGLAIIIDDGENFDLNRLVMKCNNERGMCIFGSFFMFFLQTSTIKRDK